MELSWSWMGKSHSWPRDSPLTGQRQGYSTSSPWAQTPRHKHLTMRKVHVSAGVPLHTRTPTSQQEIITDHLRKHKPSFLAYSKKVPKVCSSQLFRPEVAAVLTRGQPLQCYPENLLFLKVSSDFPVHRYHPPHPTQDTSQWTKSTFISAKKSHYPRVSWK